MHSPPTAQLTPRRRLPLAPAQRHALPEHFRSPTQPRRTPAGCAMHSPPTAQPIPRRPHHPFPPKTFARPRTATRPRRALPPPTQPDARPQAVRCIPRRRPSLAPSIFSRPSRALPLAHAVPTHAHRPHNPFPPKTFARPRTATRPSRALPLPHAAPTHAHRLRRRPPAGCAMHSPPTSQPIPRSATLSPLPFRFGHKKTAPHSACAMPNVSVDRRCGRSFGLVSRALFAAVAGRWRVGVGLRPQPWALRSRRCGRVLRA